MKADHHPYYLPFYLKMVAQEPLFFLGTGFSCDVILFSLTSSMSRRCFTLRLLYHSDNVKQHFSVGCVRVCFSIYFLISYLRCIRFDRSYKTEIKIK